MRRAAPPVTRAAAAVFARTAMRVIAIALTLAAVQTTQAQVITQPLGSEPGLNWRVGAEVAYDDNVFRTPELEDSDAYLGLQPELAWYGFSGTNQFDVTLSSDLRRYQDQDVLDFNAWGIQGHALLDHSARLTTDYTLGFEDGVEKPGDTEQLFLPGQEPNDFERWDGAWTISYGAQEAVGQLRGKVRYDERRFFNNNQQFRDADTTRFTGTFFYTVAPRTRLLLELDYTDFEFVNSDATGFNQSGDQVRYLAGVTWEATGNTTGEFRIGYRDRSFDRDQFDNLSGLALALSMSWRPNELTTVVLNANQDNQSSALQGVGGFVRSEINASYTRRTGARSRLVADVAYDERDFERGLSTDRSDDRWTTGAGFEYDLTPRISTRVEYRYEDRNSTAALFNFRANVLLLSFTFSPPA